MCRGDPPNKEIHERLLGIEEELKAQRVLMSRGFEAMDKRFSILQWLWGGGVVLISLLMSVYRFVG